MYILYIVLAALCGGLAVLFGILAQQNWPKSSPTTTTGTPSDVMIPELQVTPSDIRDDNVSFTEMVIYVLNYSDYAAKNISVDIKFGDSLWKGELRKASSLNTFDELLAQKDDPLIAHILANTSEEEQREMHRSFLGHPLVDELKPGVEIKVGMMDTNKDWVLKQELFFSSGGKDIPIEPEQSYLYQESQGWKEQIDNTDSGEPIKILLRTVWENEIGKKFGEIVEYQLICTKIGTGRSYTFLPTGNVIEDR